MPSAFPIPRTWPISPSASLAPIALCCSSGPKPPSIPKRSISATRTPTEFTTEFPGHGLLSAPEVGEKRTVAAEPVRRGNGVVALSQWHSVGIRGTQTWLRRKEEVANEPPIGSHSASSEFLRQFSKNPIRMKSKDDGNRGPGGLTGA